MAGERLLVLRQSYSLLAAGPCLDADRTFFWDANMFRKVFTALPSILIREKRPLAVYKTRRFAEVFEMLVGIVRSNLNSRGVNANHPSSRNPRGTFTLVQALRGIAAMWVVFYHASEAHHVDNLRTILPDAINVVLFDSGHYGVAIFFALSGFVIAHSLRDLAPTLGFIAWFLLRRAVRLDPPYWLSIAIVLAFGILSARVQEQAFVWPSAGNVFAHLFYLQTLLGLPVINSVYWTLTYEVQFYLVFATLLTAARALSARASWAWPATWGAMFMLALAASLGLMADAPRGLFVNLWPAFFVGAIAYYAPGDLRVLGAAMLLSVVMLWSPGAQGAFARYAAATALLLAGAKATGRLTTAFDWRFLQFLGTISYSLYLLHNPISGATAFVLRKTIGTGAVAELVILASIVAASCSGAWLYWRTIEMTAHKLSRRVKLPRADCQD